MNSKITQEAIKVGKSASEYYVLIKDMPSSLQVRVSDGFQSHLKSVELNYIDRRALSLFFALLTVSDNVHNIFSDFNVEFDDAFFYVFSVYDVIDKKKEKKDIPLEDIENNFYSYFEPMLDTLANKYKLIIPEVIAYNLLADDCCFSNVVRVLVGKLIAEKSPLSGDKLKDYLFDEASRKMVQYFESHPEVKKEIDAKEMEAVKKKFPFFGVLDNDEDDTMTEYGEFLTSQQFHEHPAVGREHEIRTVLKSLMMKSVLLLGPSGVGKTALVEEIAYLIQQKKVPNRLLDKKIFMLNASSLIAGTKYRGEFEERLDVILREVDNDPNIILFIDEICNMKGLGATEGSSQDFFNIFKPYLSRSNHPIQIIGTTTTEEYQKYWADDAAIRRRFAPVTLGEPDDKSLKHILGASVMKYQDMLHVDFSFDTDSQQEIFNILIQGSKKRSFDDLQYNPSLVLSILEMAFSNALYYDREFVNIDDVKEAVMSCERIYESTRGHMVSQLSSISNTKQYVKGKIVPFSTRQ